MPDAILTIIGVGIVIFVHELGHFVVAKRAGIRVDVFSLGFGPRLAGFRIGTTDYRLSLVPIGGYVKMAGEAPGEEEEDGEPAKDHLRAKSVGQRALVMSAGVIMNLLFAFVVFPLVFRAGVPFPAPMVGSVSPGGPAWKAGILPGDEIVAVDGEPVYEFTDITMLVALGDPRAGLDVTVRRGEGEPFTLKIYPREDEDLGAFQIGIAPLYRLAADPGSAAAEAGIRDGDFPLELDGRAIVGAAPILSKAEIEPDEPLSLRVRRGEETIDVTIPPKTRDSGPLLGVRPAIVRIGALRNDPGFHLGLKAGDVVLSENGALVVDFGDTLEAWRKREIPFATSLRVKRGQQEIDLAIEVPSADLIERAADSIAVETHENVIRVVPGGAAAEAGIEDGDRITAVGASPVTTFGELLRAVEKNGGKPVPVTFSRAGRSRTVEIAPRPQKVNDRGVLGLMEQVERRSENLIEACRVGFQCSINQVRRVVAMLKNIIGGQISAKNLGGPVTIFYVSYRYANVGLSRLFFFLAILSINLAIINLLPIPVLDGGHLLFLVVEKIKGSPVNENVIGFSQWVGLILILLLLIFVTYNDILRTVL